MEGSTLSEVEKTSTYTKGMSTFRAQKKTERSGTQRTAAAGVGAPLVNSRKGAFRWRGKWEWAGQGRTYNKTSDQGLEKEGCNSQERHINLMACIAHAWPRLSGKLWCAHMSKVG